MTTYQAPPTFAQGDFPMAAQLNILGDDVAVVYGLLFHNAVSPCVRALPAGASYLVVKRRLDWLHYRTREAESGESVSPRLSPMEDEDEDAEERYSVSLPASPDSFDSFDLRNVDWLQPGMLYRLFDVAAALEDWSD